MSADRARGAVNFGVIAVALLAFSFVTPWFTADYSSGRQTPAQGMQPAEETGVVRATLSDTPFTATGEAAPSDPAAHAQWVELIGWLTTAALSCAALVVLAEIPGIRRILVRPVSLAMATIGTLCLVTAALVGWYLIPASVGVGDSPFTAVLRADGYWRTSLGYGWALAALAVPMLLGAMASKYQAGAHDPAAIEDVARRA